MSTADVWTCLRKDDYLRQFIGKVEHPGQMITIAAAQTLSVSEQLSKLAEGITLLDKELKKQVLEKHEDLVSQATWVEKLQGVLSVMHIHVQSLLSSVERVRMKVVEPFNRIESQTTVLSRLHATSDLLRRAARIQQLVKRLPGLDPLRTAHIISELGELYQDVDLSGLDILESEERQIKKERAAVEQKALKIVQQGLQGLDQNQVAVGIEIMIKLNIAEKEVNALMEEAIKQVKNGMKNALDMNALVPSTARGGAGRVSGVNIPTNIQYFRNKLWSSWEHTLNSTIHPVCCQMTLIQNVLNNKIGDMCLSLPENEKKSDLAYIFWSEVDNLMKRSLLKAAEGSSYTKQALEVEYPKLLRMHLDFHKKLQTLNQPGSSKPIFPVIGSCLKDFETAYLTKSTNIVLTSVREMFSEGKESTPVHPPSSDKIDSLVKMISNELSVALVDSTLTEAVAKNVVAKAIKLFCQKAEEMIVTTPEASQVIESPNLSQELNISIANSVFYFSEQVKNVLNNLNVKKSIASCITTALQNGNKLTQEILNPLLASVIVAIDSILLTMHNEDYNLKEYNGASSLYMRELQAFIARAATTYLSPFQNLTLVTQSCLEVSSRTLELFMRNATLVRPISISGQKKLLSDFKTVEDAISPLCTQLSELGKIYRTLRSLRALVTAPITEVVASPVLGQVIPYSLIITFLISRGPPELPSPHQSVDWTIAAYSEWLDNHPDETSRLELLSGALQKYRKTICDQGLSTFDDIYPVIKSLLENATQYLLTKV